MLLQICALGVTMSWEEGFLGARASRPHPVPLAATELQCDAAGSHPVGGNSIGQTEEEPWRRCRLIQVGEMAEAAPGFVRAGRPSSQAMLARRCGERSGLRPTSQKADVHSSGNSCLPACPPPPQTTGRLIRGETGLFQASGAPTWRADHSRVKQRVLMPIGSKGHVPLIRFAALLNIDAQDRQD